MPEGEVLARGFMVEIVTAALDSCSLNMYHTTNAGIISSRYKSLGFAKTATSITVYFGLLVNESGESGLTGLFGSEFWISSLAE